MTVRSIVQMFENMAVSSGTEQSTHPHNSPGRGTVDGLVTYYDGLAVVEETPTPVATKTCSLRFSVSQPVMTKTEPVSTQSGPSNQEANEVPIEADLQCSTEPPKTTWSSALLVSKIPQPKSRQFHLQNLPAPCSVRKESTDSPKGSCASSASSLAAVPSSVYAPPPTPTISRMHTPGTSYAAFVAKIENSQSRLLDFEKDERWIGQVESMKIRVEVLKRRNHAALAREVASTPRKNRIVRFE
ncbi:hypothetical protein BBJ29_001832 [Phytophthora kernoviae]|uniref:Uncharacterized protein n=1 Tax=Phytophthora kernoviae TaxID=325452 RepID=A0A3F2RR54_9STRA|nr:hypothetical protein BBJ29_001832 [Phytophthora kernoviae]RLN62615.1 hypothetical protein BBP00_00004640 [Phytophthora kernoviae]